MYEKRNKSEIIQTDSAHKTGDATKGGRGQDFGFFLKKSDLLFSVAEVL